MSSHGAEHVPSLPAPSVHPCTGGSEKVPLKVTPGQLTPGRAPLGAGGECGCGQWDVLPALVPAAHQPL